MVAVGEHLVLPVRAALATATNAEDADGAAEDSARAIIAGLKALLRVPEDPLLP
jgi:hypothetical protein